MEGGGGWAGRNDIRELEGGIRQGGDWLGRASAHARVGGCRDWGRVSRPGPRRALPCCSGRDSRSRGAAFRSIDRLPHKTRGAGPRVSLTPVARTHLPHLRLAPLQLRPLLLQLPLHTRTPPPTPHPTPTPTPTPQTPRRRRRVSAGSVSVYRRAHAKRRRQSRGHSLHSCRPGPGRPVHWGGPGRRRRAVAAGA